MVAETLPCAEKRCTSNMSLLEERDGVLYYRCEEKHNEHYFRYDVAQKQWERLIVTRKLVLHFEHDPYGDVIPESPKDQALNADFEVDESAVDDFETNEPEVQDFDIEKSVVDEFEQSLVAPVKAPKETLDETPVEAPVDVPEVAPEAPVEVATKKPAAEELKEDVEIVSDLLKIKGIGSQQLKDLVDADVHTISDLAQCSASDLSKKTGLAISQLINWIVKAKTLTEDEVAIPA